MTISPSDPQPVFVMTAEEVKYFLQNIEHEYINKDRYYETSNLIKRMRHFLEELDELARGIDSAT